MNPSVSVGYLDAKIRVVRAINRVTTFVRASQEFNDDRLNADKRAKIKCMLTELNTIRHCVEEDIQRMESAVNSNTAPADVTDNSTSNSLIDSFDSLYYTLVSFADVNQMMITSNIDVSQKPNMSTIPVGDMTSSFIQYPKRKFPTFSGLIKDWQSFEQLFLSILSHTPDLPAVEKFEILKTSLEGEARILISHLSLTAANYNSAWEILRGRYGNKRDLARIHLEPLLSSYNVKATDATSIKNQLNCILEHTSALDNLDFITRQWSPILIHIFEKNLDRELRSRWESTVGENHCPKINEFVDFLRRQIRTADIQSTASSFSTSTTNQTKSNVKQTTVSNKYRSGFSSKVLTTMTNPPPLVNCPLCQVQHLIRKCPIFLGKGASERFQIAKNHQLCINCLGPGHSVASCPSKYKCQTCTRAHHSLLHFEKGTSHAQPSTSGPVSENLKTTSCTIKGTPKQVILLSTVVIDVCAADGNRHSLRALIDSGSQASFVTEKAACTLMLRRCTSNVNISTFASTDTTPVRSKTTLVLTPVGQKSPKFNVETYIVPTITGLTPQVPINPGKWDHITNLTLADPSYHLSRSIDVLLGADILPFLFLDGRITGNPGEPTAINTVFGWILMGPINTYETLNVTTLTLTTSEALDASLKQFWELEELPSVRHFSPDEDAAEQIYKNTTSRLSSGRFMVKIPFRTPSPVLGDSKSLALRHYRALERRLEKNDDLRKQYVDFMADYLANGHMELVPRKEIDNIYNYYIPHHCVMKPESSTTKLRVVFNASARTSSGCSLNESMYTGPKLQPNIQTVLLRSRLWQHLFTTDVKQMYRQILVHPADRNYLRIFWRFSQNTPIEEYRLCTVTYGTSAAPYQALRTIRELAKVEEENFPRAAAILMNDTFVDDILTGANTEEDVLECQNQLIALCSCAQLELRKWASNNVKILESVPEQFRAMSPSVLFDHNEQSELKVLGLNWDPAADVFSYSTRTSTSNPTKRSVLSDIARVFDPLGLLSPLTFWTKHLMQQLWAAGIKWDDQIPHNVGVMWKRYQAELNLIETLCIPRRVTHNNALSLQLHVFSDSSEKGYAAAVYLRIETSASVQCHLVTGKSKVAPLKRATIPRLELCGAVLAAKLLRVVVDLYSSHLNIDQLYAWTDSTTTLSWIRSSPHRWATFVANRTSQIQQLTSPSIWQHVPTQYNPVDCASRGLYPSELIHHPLWWTGPPYLLEPSDKWPSLNLSSSDDTDKGLATEARKVPVLLIQLNNEIVDVMNRFSSLYKILRIIAFCLRIVTSRSVIPSNLNINALEIDRALSALVYYVQQTTYQNEILCLTKGLRCSKNLRQLDPFVDEKGFVRVGGRLRNSDLPYAHKYPLLLPSRHRLTDLLIDHHHHRLKHPGAAALQTHLQHTYWIQSARRAIRSRIRKCIACFRTKPRSIQPKMGNLPRYRLQQIKPFAICGVDYAGPLTIKESRGRRVLSSSAYICLFVCTTTKAIHLEVSSDLSTEKFLMALTRFSARRGPIKEIHSDCGTNFVGAARLLTPLQEIIHSHSFQDSVHNHLAKQQIQWHFNPPASPHFGGLWEAGVKSTKSLLLRSIGSHIVTNEELTTLLTQVEATLNSRPLCPLSNDPTDYEALTPSHFLTLEPSTTLPDPSLTSVPLSKMQRWRLISDVHRHFWTRWQMEYLSSLQVRHKWSSDGAPLCVDDLVLIKEPTHPLQWKLGRVRTLHPGNDGISRVATVDTSKGTLLRPTVKLCPLPIC